MSTRWPTLARQLRQGAQAAREVGPAPAGTGDHAANHQPLVQLAAVPFQLHADRRGGRQLELRLDLRFLAAGADHLGAAARPTQQRQRVDQDALACAGLAGDHGQTGTEGELDPLDERETGDAEEREHRGLPPFYLAIPPAAGLRLACDASVANGAGSGACGAHRSGDLGRLVAGRLPAPCGQVLVLRAAIEPLPSRRPPAPGCLAPGAHLRFRCAGGRPPRPPPPCPTPQTAPVPDARHTPDDHHRASAARRARDRR